ncbi:MAG: NAD-dependent epimerase/dehydratase family protein, partial [Alphaproteobacteria bacterium]|nr:NAD-dependent epimerase/dehydratase family protein [Alphaproteobacteria bacterium]
AKGGATLGVNQNFIYHPAFAKLLALVSAKSLGPLRAVDCIYNMPLRQLAAGQLGHWMFDKPVNILLEQAVHPLSQICALVGEVGEMAALATSPVEISPGIPFHDSVDVSLRGQQGQAHLYFAMGREYPVWQITAVCDDGAIVADMIGNRFFTSERTRWLEFLDTYLSGRRVGRLIGAQARRNALDYLLATFHLKPRSDAFFLSMKASIEAFHRALDAGETPRSDGRFGAGLVGVCERIATTAFTEAKAPRATPAVGTPRRFDVAVLGGTGFIGAHVVKRLLREGRTVGVMARTIRNLAPPFYEDGVTLIGGDVNRGEDIERGIGEARAVINLAHGGGGDSWPEIERTMVGSARRVAENCQRNGVAKLVHVSSIAALYLGDGSAVISGRTPPDPRAEKRGIYARGKAESDRVLLNLHAQAGLPVCILRPGVVVGEGGIAFHSGFGFYNNEQHCLGWNQGDNPLPLVLAGDVADAIVLALDRDRATGRCYNLVGDVLLTAKECIEVLGEATGRPLRYHPQSVGGLQAVEVGKWLIKLLIGRGGAYPSYRDLKSRGLTARFDCSDAKNDLGWRPQSDRAAFLRDGIEIYATPIGT